MSKFNKYIHAAVKAGKLVEPQDWRNPKVPSGKLTIGEKICRFAERYLYVPDGQRAKQPLRLTDSQEAFICSMFEPKVRQGVYSTGKRSGKTFLTAIIVMALLAIGEDELEVPPNALIVSGALTLGQAETLFKKMKMMLKYAEDLHELLEPKSNSTITNVLNGITYEALSAEGATNHGKTVFVSILDEAFGIEVESNAFTTFLETSLSSYTNSRYIIISTQASKDDHYLSRFIDTATDFTDGSRIAHVYTAPDEFEIEDEQGWYFANPSLSDGLVDIDDLRRQVIANRGSVARMANFENFVLNRRVQRGGAWISPQYMKLNAGKPDFEVFRNNWVTMGVDLSTKNDLTACVISASDDEGITHLYPFCFTRDKDIERREREEKFPYQNLIEQGHLIVAGHDVIRYSTVVSELVTRLEDFGVNIDCILYDQHKWKDLELEIERQAAFPGAKMQKIAQGFYMNPQIVAFEDAMFEGRLRHGNHPMFLRGASEVTIKTNTDGLKQIIKSVKKFKIDVVVAAVMAAHWDVTGRHSETFDDEIFLV